MPVQREDADGNAAMYLDGVLVDSYTPHYESWRQLAEEIGSSCTEQEFAATFGRTSREILREAFGVEDPDLIKQYDDRKEAIYRDVIRHDVPAMEGAMALVRALHDDGFSLASEHPRVPRSQGSAALGHPMLAA